MYIYSVDCKKDLKRDKSSSTMAIDLFVRLYIGTCCAHIRSENGKQCFCIHFLSTTHFWFVKKKIAQWNCLQFYLNTDSISFIQGCSDGHLAMVVVCLSFQQSLWCEQKGMCTTSNASTASSADNSSAKVTIVQ